MGGFFHRNTQVEVTDYQLHRDTKGTEGTDGATVANPYPEGYALLVVAIRQTEVFATWFNKLPDRRARARILVRIRRLTLGNPGDVAPVGEGVSEMRIHYGPGYRVYYVQRGQALIVLLAGGDKKTQKRDIQRALELAREL